MSRHVVGTVDDFPEGGVRIVEVGGRSIGIYHVNGRFRALRNRCPHQGGPLCLGTVGGALESSVPGSYRYDRARSFVECPWHGWEFDLETGQSWFDPAGVRVRAYPVTTESPAAVEERAPAGGAPGPARSQGAASRSPGGPQPGPYQAEVYPVEVEERYVVIDLRARVESR